jgi:Fe-S-cluster containining protein
MKKEKRKTRREINCNECKTQSDCCRFGAWIDLEEAKKIISAGIKGDFFHLEKDKSFPSGFRIGTSIEDNPCVFLDKDGLCRIHKYDYSLKPVTCKEFPYENGRISSFADVLCTLYRNRIRRRTRNKKRRVLKK